MENDASVSQLSLEKTASTVERATTKVERTTRKNAPATTGRTAWDALVDMGGMLGRYTPWIIIVAGTLFGIYKFTELQNNTQKTAQDMAHEQVTQAHADLRDTYTRIGEMHKQQLDNLSSMLKVSKETLEDTEKQRRRLNEMQETTKTKLAEAEDAKKAADKAHHDVTLAQKQRDDAQREIIQARHRLNDIKNELAKVHQELREKESTLDRKVEAINQRAAHIMGLRNQMIELAKTLITSTDASVATLGRDILNEASLEASKSLTAYAKQPGKETAEPLSDLVGSNEETLEAALPKGLGFAFWQKYSKKDGTKAAYIGVVRQTDVTDEGVVYLEVSKNKVVDVLVLPRALSVAGRDPDDWNKQIAYNLYLRRTGMLGIDLFTPQTDRWTIPETTEFANEEPPKKIYGSEKPLYFMSLDDFKKEAEIYETAKASYRGGFSNMVAMLENEKGFDANKLAEPFATEMPKGIRDTFVQLLTESVKRAEVKSVEIASASKLPREIYGPIAAAALKRDFKIVKIEAVQSNSASTVSSTKGEMSVILCGYRTVEESMQYARLTFTREGADGKWMLLNFENPVVLPSARAE